MNNFYLNVQVNMMVVKDVLKKHVKMLQFIIKLIRNVKSIYLKIIALQNYQEDANQIKCVSKLIHKKLVQ